MFIILILILTIISIALKLGASGVDLAQKVADRSVSSSVKGGVVKFGLTASSSAMRLSAIITARIRDMVAIVGTFAVIMELVIFLLVVTSASGFMALFVSQDKDGNLTWSNEALSAASGNTSTNVSSDGSDSSVVALSGEIEGIDRDSWNSADDIGRSVAYFASNAILNPPNGKYMKYTLDTKSGQGWWDCVTFVEATLQGSLHMRLDGKKTKKGFDFATDSKADLEEGIVNVAMLWKMANKKPECIIGTSKKDIDKAQPGDILVKTNKSHAALYVGKNTDGKHIIVHASMRGAKCRNNVLLRGSKNIDVGFMNIDYADFYIIRTSKLIGK